jgi:hypothetical protein
MAKKNVSPSQTLKIDEVFDKKGWEVNSTTRISLYNNYVKRLSVLPEDTKDFFLELTQRFENITSLSQIIILFKDAFSKINSQIIDESRKVYFLPLIIPILGYENKSNYKFLNWLLKQIGLNKKTYTERPERKSCDFMISLLEIEYRDMYGHAKFVFPKQYSKFKRQYDKKKDLIILVDDFVGTGDTAATVLDFYIQTEKYNSDNIKLLTIISQKNGISKIRNEFNVDVITGMVNDTSITSYYGIDADFKKLVVEKMSKSLNIKSDFFGYKDSEALVCILNKSPNNTLPIFWHETKSNPAPFPRNKIYN